MNDDVMEDEDEIARRTPLCSVLLTVVDHAMIDPSPLEPRELSDGTPVPVLRVFGPILRPGHPPLQSACLYIHGAFPYLLARPRVAGPDGSLHRSAHRLDHKSSLSVDDYLDWDSVAAVQSVLPILQATLETTLQTSLQSFASDKKPTTTRTTRFIRSLTVVEGRGFYTYCPGPPAPFLRVEYYNPSQRWRVKAALERGLDVAASLYPDPRQYQASLGDLEQQMPLVSTEEGLSFHCYEAHIPYTMQFFKDYNLAGLSYLHMAEAYFRTPMPCSAPPGTCHGGDDNDDDEALFLAANTSEWQWQDPPQAASSSQSPLAPMASLQQASQPTSTAPSSSMDQACDIIAPRLPAGPWSVRGTSCHVELDMHVDAILNIDDILTEIHNDVLDSCHWRAVPSLREIWTQERRRMARLLPPAEDFLSHPATTTPPFTLNVKRHAELPGARLARQGMERLVRVTEGLEESFRRVMRDIVQRHQADVERVDRLLQEQAKRPRLEDQLTPSHEDVLQALRDLGESFADGIQQDGASPSPACASSRRGRGVDAGDRFRALSQSYYSSQQSSVADSGLSDFELSQRIDRGDPVVDGPFEHAEDFIDPETLAPFAAVDDEEDDDGLEDDEDDEQDERQVERALSILATQTLGDHEMAERTGVLALDDSSDDESGPHDVLADAGSHSDTDDLLEMPAREQIDVADKFANHESKAPEAKIPSPWLHPGRVVVERNSGPPARSDLLRSVRTNLLPMPTVGNVPTWMSFTAENQRSRAAAKSNSDWFPNVPAEGVQVRLTRSAPSSEAVASWWRRSQKRMGHQTSLAAKRVKPSIRETVDALKIDENSLKRVPRASQASGATSSEAQREVEEVAWQSSQNAHLSLTQQSRGDNTTGVTVVVEQSSLQEPQDRPRESASQSLSKSTPDNTMMTAEAETPGRALQGIGNQGGRILVEGGGQLKAKTRPSLSTSPQRLGKTASSQASQYLPSPLTLMSVEVHVQCRVGKAGVGDSKEIAMTPNSSRDCLSAIVFVYARDPGGGEALEIIETGCLMTPLERELEMASKNGGAQSLDPFAGAVRAALPERVMGRTSKLTIECVRDERQLLLRFASIVRWKDPDMLMSWDTQGAGLGYIIERGIALGKSNSGDSGAQKKQSEIDMARLLGRTPTATSEAAVAGTLEAIASKEAVQGGGDKSASEKQWTGSGLGSDWDDRVGAGAAAASIVGRLVFAAWKIIAEEVKHPNASYLPAIVSTVLGKRIPYHDNIKLAEWYGHSKGKERWRVLHHRLTEAAASVLLFDALDVIGRAGEAARLSGVEFSQSFPGIRGSQYKVEGVLLRALKSLNSQERGSKRGRRRLSRLSADGSVSLSNESTSQTQSPWKARRRPDTRETTRDLEEKPTHRLQDRGYFFFSPSLRDTNRQEALQVQALTLEPQSGHQQDPVVVCDFTALYPSLVIAYNLCYSTVAGHLHYHSTRNEMLQQGRTTGKVGPFFYSEGRTATVLKHHLRSLSEDEAFRRDRAYIAPTGTIYVSESVVRGVLPQVLDEMLSTRAMLKKAAKQYKRLVPNLAPSILRQLEARQLALKYVANVTYGYTSATFSGRCAMPLLADTIVECGRRTLTSAINLANSWGSNVGHRWAGAVVLYGDTDSVFVKLPGRSVQEAFQFGEEFCKAVTACNPPPVQLKLEKVYLGSIMQTKKKYCGMKFESKDQAKPIFEAKGIETVRRDQCTLTQKVLRNSLVTLFQKGVDAVKKYLFRQWALILSGRLPVSDFILTGRVRSRYRGGRIGPVQAALARRLAEADPGRVVRHKERLAYVIVATPGVAFTLRDCVLTPMELLEQWDAYTINTAYYITKHVNAALKRCLSLAPHKIDVDSWYMACPKPRPRIHFWPITRSGNSVMISSYFGSDLCALCGSKCRAAGRSRAAVCLDCSKDCVRSLESAMSRLGTVQREGMALARRCNRCNLCFEDSTTFAEQRVVPKQRSQRSMIGAQQFAGIVTPLANCTCIDCPTTFERHRVREAELEAIAICEALDAL